MRINQFIEQYKLNANFSAQIERHYIPFAKKLVASYHDHSATFFLGINGCQGSGKSTLSKFIKAYIESEYGFSVLTVSLDDFYLSKAARQKLAQTIHPLLSMRGVPGTHDILLFKQTLLKLKQGLTGAVIPLFNKAVDDLRAKKHWLTIDGKVDIVIVEGWCWGTPAQLVSELSTPVNDLELKSDSEGIWRSYVNRQVQNNYQPLYDLMDHWLFLRAPSIDCVYQWRLQQERHLAASLVSLQEEVTKNQLQSAEQIASFILYFQRLTQQSLDSFSYLSQTTFHLDKHRKIVKLS